VTVAAAGAQLWVNPRGFPYAGREPCDGHGHAVLGYDGMRDAGHRAGADVGAAQVSEPRLEATSHPNVRALGVPLTNSTFSSIKNCESSLDCKSVIIPILLEIP
jgi:hypothetical protein